MQTLTVSLQPYKSTSDMKKYRRTVTSDFTRREPSLSTSIKFINRRPDRFGMDCYLLRFRGYPRQRVISICGLSLSVGLEYVNKEVLKNVKETT